MDRQVVFVELSSGGFRPDGSEIVTKKLRKLNGFLPKGMFAKYTVTRYPDGTEFVEVTMQARGKHGKRRFGASSESAAQARLIAWSNRILSEREKEGS